jgi:thymidine phosphorylase
MAVGTFFYVVGPSGAGKDTLIAGAKAALPPPDYVFARRVITRPAGSAGEDHEAADDAAFIEAEARGEFLISWQAHGLRYGLRKDLLDKIESGRHVIANGSRAAASELIGRVPRLVIVEVSAPDDVLAQRIAGRGREQGAAVTARIERKTPPLPAHVTVVRVNNDGCPEQGVVRFIETIQIAAQETAPQSRAWMTKKARGEPLNEAEYDAVIRDIHARRYDDRDIRGFLTAATSELSEVEILALAKVRARYANTIRWEHPLVADKHSLGGAPGSRITLIVVPIVAAHGGPIMPKTSSRAITSAAGTADAMETIARVDLTPREVRDVVERTNACIAWNGKLNHSHVDTVMNAITRPLNLDSARWAVASILSKKLAAGSTHVVIDIPWGPGAKARDAAHAIELGGLFEKIGAELGLTIKAVPTDGSRPIGRGIGPALEVRDVLRVLDNDPDAPADLREKALTFAATIIGWDPHVANEAVARERAGQLLRSGAARTAFDAIIDAQGRHDPVVPGALTQMVAADRSGTVARIDGYAISAIARDAGAPVDKSAGVDLAARIGDRVQPGDLLYLIHGSAGAQVAAAAARAKDFSGYILEG